MSVPASRARAQQASKARHGGRQLKGAARSQQGHARLRNPRTEERSRYTPALSSALPWSPKGRHGRGAAATPLGAGMPPTQQEGGKALDAPRQEGRPTGTSSTRRRRSSFLKHQEVQFSLNTASASGGRGSSSTPASVLLGTLLQAARQDAFWPCWTLSPSMWSLRKRSPCL
jgi:hypothetical protein